MESASSQLTWSKVQLGQHPLQRWILCKVLLCEGTEPVQVSIEAMVMQVIQLRPAPSQATGSPHKVTQL